MPPATPIKNRNAKIINVIAATLSEATPKLENNTTATLSRKPKPPKEMGRNETVFIMGIKTKKWAMFNFMPKDKPIK